MPANPQLHPPSSDAIASTRQGRTTPRALMGEDPALRAAYRVCRCITRRHDPGIYALIQLMPAVLRPACWALWAAASTLDDLADEPDASPAERASRVDAWTKALRHDQAVGSS